MLITSVFYILLALSPVKGPPRFFHSGCWISGTGLNKFLAADCGSFTFDIKGLADLPINSLDISGISLREVPDLSGLQELRHLDLSNNQISYLPGCNFSAFPNLKSLNLSHNLITEMPEEPCRMDSIDVSHNQLTDMHSLVGLFKTKDARVMGNPIRCNCSSPLVQRFYTHAKQSTLRNIECILHDSDSPKPLSTQCHKEINEEQTLSKLPIIVIIALLILVVGIIILCNRH
ncbi:insulin-like growth factor-binding protein complex acid labile subunit [Drosophila ficusphila]|uniref:insulin-like growth factor-binding protein complex acid labile subunit n=1 Tax=Drosophila ficusphila TaxID=30025 RepID=UPI0007E83972|nr:insulin-like growth factor-binding protein complex acid labile subunit [Drosophila ficusphila]XP_017057666.1 insulin-like growth factor-binding protein complex acid labile subunit [Drosophila ficusphila]